MFRLWSSVTLTLLTESLVFNFFIYPLSQSVSQSLNQNSLNTNSLPGLKKLNRVVPMWKDKMLILFFFSFAAAAALAWNSACLSRCSRGDRPLVERYLEPGGFTDDAWASHYPSVFTSFTGWSSKRCPGHWSKVCVKTHTFDYLAYLLNWLELQLTRYNHFLFVLLLIKLTSLFVW